MPEEFKPGDVVKLKSGGPRMTVDDVDVYMSGGKPQAKCVWFEDKKRYEALFELPTLVHTHA